MPGNFDTFLAALDSAAYLSSIQKKPSQFLQTLEDSEFSFPQLFEAINKVKQNRTARTVLIIHLLSNKRYLNNLRDESILDRLSHNTDKIEPSRLNAWVHQIDASVLTINLINKLQPEAAVSILCSIPHFHLLSETQVNALLEKYLENSLIVYWIRYFPLMPNAHHLLAHLMKKVYVNVCDAIKNLEPTNKEQTLIKIIENLNSFTRPLPKRLLSLTNQESHLILAIRLYLNGHYYQIYIDFIKNLVEHLLQKKEHSFSPIAIELLFALQGVAELKETLIQVAHLTNPYLKANAQAGTISLFYRDGNINIQRASAPVHLNPKESTQASSEKQNATDENALINSLPKKEKPLKCIEYFLIQYQGDDTKPLSKLLNDYLAYYAPQNRTVFRDAAIHQLSILLGKDETPPQVKEVLFSSFLRHPELFDEQTSIHLFLYNATKALQYYGLQGGEHNYQTVIDLCTFALSRLKPETQQDLINIAEQAQNEAQLELEFSKQTGMFSSLFKYIKRCWRYGWTGFFLPKSPTYVIPESALGPKEYLRRGSESQSLSIQPIKDLPALVQEIELQPTITQDKLELLIKALELYSLKDKGKDELEIRSKINQLYQKIIGNREDNEELYSWLMTNQKLFLDNQQRLIGLTLKEKSIVATQSLIATDPTGMLERLKKELNPPIPTLKEETLIKKAEPEENSLLNAVTGTIGAVTGTIGSAIYWGAGFFTTPVHTTSAQIPHQGNTLRASVANNN